MTSASLRVNVLLTMCMLISSGCVCKDTLVIGYEKRGSFTSKAADFEGPCTLWPHRAWNDAAFGRLASTSIDEPWTAQKLFTVQVQRGDVIGFRRGADGNVVAFWAQGACELPDDDYGWYRPKNPGEAAVEGGLLAPARFVGGTAVVAGVLVSGVVLTANPGDLKFGGH